MNSMASTRPITPMEEVDMDKAIAAITDVEDYKAIIKAWATTEKALVKDPEEVNSKIKLDIDKRSVMSVIK
jgi:hypothetical protein